MGIPAKKQTSEYRYIIIIVTKEEKGDRQMNGEDALGTQIEELAIYGLMERDDLVRERMKFLKKRYGWWQVRDAVLESGYWAVLQRYL